jgi:2-oxo-4-hydroxy-4-carboxy-5-ureidoimidazoline decarboxylase
MGIAGMSVLEHLTASDLERCCGASRWVVGVNGRRPFRDAASVFAAARDVFAELTEPDWLEAFRHHPRIGDIDSLRKKFATTREWAAGEQSGAAGAAEETLQALAEGNHLYEERFGFIFIICATGKSADEMLQLLRARLPNERSMELRLAAAEQEKITHLRLEKLLAS